MLCGPGSRELRWHHVLWLQHQNLVREFVHTAPRISVRAHGAQQENITVIRQDQTHGHTMTESCDFARGHRHDAETQVHEGDSKTTPLLELTQLHHACTMHCHAQFLQITVRH